MVRIAWLMVKTALIHYHIYFTLQYALHVYDSLMSAGKNYGIRNAGYYALRALRTEKFYAYWGTDLNPRTTPQECGREYRVKFNVSIIEFGINLFKAMSHSLSIVTQAVGNVSTS